MDNRDMPAAPFSLEMNKSIEEGYWYDFIGLTKREHFAGLAMQGYLAADKELENGPKPIAEWAVQNADALLEELEK